MGLKVIKSIKRKKDKEPEREIHVEIIMNPREVMKKRRNFQEFHSFSVTFSERLGFH